MRTTFVQTLIKLAERDKDILLLTADLGFKLFDHFREAYPKQFVNMGVAEQNMIGVAAGLGLEGKKVYCYSMVPFLTFRTLEHIRVDLCYHNIGVTLIGVGGGLTYGLEGMTHQAFEDIAVMRSLPNMTVVAPGDPLECRAIIQQSAKYEHPLYVRLGGNNDPVVHQGPIDFRVGKGIVIKKGADLCMIASGTMLARAKQVVENLNARGVFSTLVSMPTLKPIDEELIRWCGANGKYIVTLEEHSEIGGLGSAVAECLFNIGWHGRFLKIALTDQFCNVVGCADYLREKRGLSSTRVLERIIKFME